MTPRARRAFVRILACAWALSVAARASPGFWDRVQSQKQRRAARLLLQVERASAPRVLDEGSADIARKLAQAAAVMLDLGGAEELGDSRLLLLLGQSWLRADVGQERRAAGVLRKALEGVPDVPGAAAGWFALARAESALGHGEAEARALERALELEWRPESRAHALLHRAESLGFAGELAGALRDLDAARAWVSGGPLLAAIDWGKAVVLERGGDLPAAVALVRSAAAHRFNLHGQAVDLLELPAVYFDPPYERFYYRGLERMAAAEIESDPHTAVRVWSEAERSFARYVERADARGVSWAERAARLVLRCQRFRHRSGTKPGSVSFDAR